MSSQKTMKDLIQKIKRRGGVGYMVVVIPVPYVQIQRLIEILEFDDERVFLVDLTWYLLNKHSVENPFIKTMMEIPNRIFTEGVPYQKEFERILEVILDWVERVDLKEFEEILEFEQRSIRKHQLQIKPTDAFLAQSCAVVEFEVSADEDAG